MNNENYDCAYFIAKFEALADRDVGLGHIGSRCALYHCGIGGVADYYPPTQEALALATVLGFKRSDNKPYGYAERVYYINDGHNTAYQQPTPRRRILAALHDIKRQQEEAAEAFELRPLNLSKQPKEASCVQV